MGYALIAVGPAGSGTVQVPCCHFVDKGRSHGNSTCNPSLRLASPSCPSAATIGYKQLVTGPAGSGKLTDCSSLYDHRQTIGSSVHSVNLDPAAEQFDYPPDSDTRDEQNSTDDLMYNMEHLDDSLNDWLDEQLEKYLDDNYHEFEPAVSSPPIPPALPLAGFLTSPAYALGAHRRVSMPRAGVQAALSASSRYRRSHSVVVRALPRASSFSLPGTMDKDYIRQCLMRHETIIFYNFLERAEYCQNLETYDCKNCKILGFSGTLIEYIMQETEKSHAQAGRYKYPGETPFFGEILFEPRLPLIEYPEVLDYGALSINLNQIIWDCYFNKVLPALVKKGSDGNNGLTAVCDTKILQALSARVHFGMLLAEVKFRESPDLYEQAILEQDIKKLRKLVTDAETDEMKLREEQRTATFGLNDSPLKFKFQLVCQLFDKYMSPLIVEAQAQYLLAKGIDGDLSASGVRKTIRLKALSKRTQFLVRAAPSLIYLAKTSVVLVFAIVFALSDKILEYFRSRGFVPGKTTMAIWALCLLSAKGAYEVLNKAKEVLDLAMYYVKLLEKDKEKP